MKSNFQKSAARLIIYLLIANAIVTALGLGILFFFLHIDFERFIGSLIFIPIFGSLLLLLRRGHERTVKLIAVTLNFSLILLQVWLDGGIRSPDFFTLLIGIILATLAFGLPGAVITSIFSMAAGFVFTFLQTSPQVYLLPELIVIQCSTFLTIAFYFYFSFKLFNNELNHNVQLNEKLAISEEKFRTIIEQSSESIILVDEQGKIIQANKAMETLSGLASGQVLGEYYWDFQAKITPAEIRLPERTERNKQNILAALKSGEFPIERPIEADFIRADGKKRTILNSAFIVRSNMDNYLCSMALDITERKQAAETMALQQVQLLEAEQKRRITLETIESISLDLRKANDKTDFYSILLKRCIEFLGVKSGLVFEPVGDKFVLSMRQGMEWPESVAELQRQMGIVLTGFSENSQTILLIKDSFFNQPIILVKLLSEHRVLGFLVFFWQDDPITGDIQTILQTIAEIGGIALDRMQVLGTLEERVMTRTRELRVVYDIMQLYISNEDIRHVIREALKIFVDSTSAIASIFFLANSEGGKFELIGQSGEPAGEKFEGEPYFNLQDLGWKQVLQSDKPVLLGAALYPFVIQENDLPANANHFIGVPVRTEKGLLAVIGFLFAGEINISLSELNLINLFSDQIAMVIERNLLRQQLKNAAIIEERQRLSRELHDSLTQSLYSLKLLSDAGRRLAKQKKWEELQAQLDAVFDIASQGLKEMRLLVYELVPETIETLGLVTALEQRLNYVEKRAGVAVEFIHEGSMDLPQKAQMNLYRIAQEALNNVAKHALATKIQVHLARKDKKLSLQISDNGKGFDLSNSSPGMGLRNMQERARQLGGQIKIDSQPETGTTVLFEIGEAPT